MAQLLTALALAITPAWDGHCRTNHCRERMTARHWVDVARPYRPWLAKVRQCESGGRYRIATGNGFFGAYQFTLSSWAAVGGRGMPHQARPLEQDYRAVRLLKLQGRGAWPVCG